MALKPAHYIICTRRKERSTSKPVYDAVFTTSLDVLMILQMNNSWAFFTSNKEPETKTVKRNTNTKIKKIKFTLKYVMCLIYEPWSPRFKNICAIICEAGFENFLQTRMRCRSKSYGIEAKLTA